ncbi:MAG: VCBS repeat-containing protein [Nitrospinaceae bacterium]|jgi:hypothetical protein|nr:MAG: VCBS repeat-containing protein [Nitrospinaceae bacterium]
MKAWKPSRTGGAPFHPGAGRWALVLCLLAGLGFACSKDPSVADNPHRQHYLDATRKLFSKPLPQPILQAGFTAADRNRHPDLLLLADQGAKGKAVFVYFNRPTEGKLEQTGEPQTVAEAGEEVLHLATADFDRDHADDVILILKTGQGMRVKILFNNGKAYYYEKIKYALPPVRAGVTRVDLLDVDDDRDVDLLFSGPLLRHGDGRTDEHQAQLFINNGLGEFRDFSRLLLPPAPPGISGVSYADYDGDRIPDLFVMYGNGQNRMFLNNGLGKFTDATRRSLPAIADETVSADWADFDQDEDNDLLVVNRRLLNSATSSGETSYFLENNGRGEFSKRSYPGLPALPALNVYLLDANGDTMADALILNGEGVLYLQGKGKWRFSNETLRRLPRFHRFQELVFADVDRDHFLDLFGIENGPRRRGLLWLNRID